MIAEHATDRATELEWEFAVRETSPSASTRKWNSTSNGNSARLRPLIRSICGEARRFRSRLLTLQGGLRGRAIVHARKWLRHTSSRWPYERLSELTRRELDILAGCLYGLASAIGEEPEPYRRLRSDIGKLLRVPSGEFDGEAGFDDLLRPQRSGSADSEIFPPDGRRLVTNTLLVPFRFVCCLEVTFVNPVSGQTVFERGTGTLISDRHVLTAAHVVFDLYRSPCLPSFPVRYLRAQNILVAPDATTECFRSASPASPTCASTRGGRRRRPERRRRGAHWTAPPRPTLPSTPLRPRSAGKNRS